MTSAPAPQQFGKYQLIERVAVGGMAEVYRARTFGAAGFEKELAIKRILPRFSGDAEFVNMFIGEARLAARLSHPNLVQIFDFDCVEQPGGASYYIAMEWVDGRDVRQLSREMARVRRAFTPSAAVHIAVETLRGLHYAHTRVEGGRALGIVHRDVSPHNILVSYSGDVKLSDFGIAKAAARASATSQGTVKGKLAYMSPEQIAGQPLDPRSDVFSLGIVLYEMLTGTRLFGGGAEAEVIARVRACRVPPPSSRSHGVAPDVEAVVLGMLSRDPADRPSSAAEAARALAATSSHSPTEAMALGEFVAELFPPRHDTGARSQRTQPAWKEGNMANQSSDPPSSKPPGGDVSGAATMMLEAPQIPAPAPAAAAVPVNEQRTAILDTQAPDMAALRTQIADARASQPPARGAPLAEQRTAILDVGSPQMAAAMDQVNQARARGAGAPPPSAPPPVAPPIADQRTAILDLASPAHAGLTAQVSAARAGQAPSSPQRTVALDVGAPPSGPARAAPRGQSLAPLSPRSRNPVWIRWVLGPAISLFMAGATYATAGVLMPVRPTLPAPPPPPPPPPVPTGRLHLETAPPGASVTVNGKPHPRFTPTDLEGPIGATAAHLVVHLDGYKAQEQDVLFSSLPQKLALNLERAEAPVDPRRHGGHRGAAAAPPPVAAPQMTPVPEKGTLDIRVDANITLDGQSIGRGPIRSLVLAPGHHTVELFNHIRGKREVVELEVAPGPNPPLSRSW